MQVSKTQCELKDVELYIIVLSKMQLKQVIPLAVDGLIKCSLISLLESRRHLYLD